MRGIILQGMASIKRDFLPRFWRRPARVIGVVTLLVCVPTVRAESARDEATFRLASPHLQVGFDVRSGQLRELVDLNLGYNLLGRFPGPLWEVELATAEGPLLLAPEHAGSFKAEPLPQPQRGGRLTWMDFPAAHAQNVSVQVEVHLDESAPLSRWSFALAGLRDQVVRQVRFPRVPDIAAQDTERLAVPVWQGQLATHPRELLNPAGGNPRRHQWEYPGRLALQCLAIYRPDGPGLYLACDDTNANRKTFAVFGGANTNLGCEIVHEPEGSGTSGHFQVSYQVVLGSFTGDWFTAAERYRAWARDQVWARESRLRQSAVPDWIRNTGIWVWNRGRSTNVLGPAVELQKQLNLPVSVLWHWWHGCSYDTGFPEYLPPREGTKPFQAALAAAHQHDVRALVYMNQRLWGMTTASWTNEHAERFAVKDPTGQIRPEVYNTFTKAPCVPMCMGTTFWRDTYAGLAERAIRELGVDGIYMDQACTSLACYDSTHGHPLGGGTYWMHGFRDLAADIRQRAGVSGRRPKLVSPRFSANLTASPRVALAGEGCGEPWLPYLDLMLSLEISRERYAPPDGWETIPFFNAVYHDSVITFGNYSSLTLPPYDDLWPAEFAPKEPLKLLDRKFSRQFYLEQARAFVWGQQPTVANFLPRHLQERPEETQFATRLATLRCRAAKYLQHGTFLRPPRIDAPEATIDMSRLSIYAGQQGGLTTFQKRVPLALAGAWRAADGTTAIALASISDEPMELSFKLEAKEYALPKRGWIYRLDETGRRGMSEFTTPEASVKLTLPPRAAYILEFRPATSH
ncbi:MAG: hypothetical protein KIS67_26880 [Verrucomicrobiae bacterium]|nr:hypothetical protein [Verrucomicrobiae bacterium]